MVRLFLIINFMYIYMLVEVTILIILVLHVAIAILLRIHSSIQAHNQTFLEGGCKSGGRTNEVGPLIVQSCIARGSGGMPLGKF